MPRRFPDTLTAISARAIHASTIPPTIQDQRNPQVARFSHPNLTFVSDVFTDVGEYPASNGYTAKSTPFTAIQTEHHRRQPQQRDLPPLSARCDDIRRNHRLVTRHVLSNRLQLVRVSKSNTLFVLDLVYSRHRFMVALHRVRQSLSHVAITQRVLA